LKQAVHGFLEKKNKLPQEKSFMYLIYLS